MNSAWPAWAWLAINTTACGPHANSSITEHNDYCTGPAPNQFGPGTEKPTVPLPTAVDLIRICHYSESVLPELDTVETIGAGGLDVEYNDNLMSLEPAALRSIQTRLTVEANSLRILKLASLGYVGDLWIDSNTLLDTLVLPDTLQTFGAVMIHDNPRLPQCQVQKIVDQLRAHGLPSTYLTTGNDETATCP